MTTDSLIPLDQQTVVFYDDEITAVKAEDGTIYVPLKPICELLGIAWAAQRRRINRDEILSEALTSVTVTVTEGGQRGQMLALPLDLLNGWLFGINASRVKPAIKPTLLRYQRECYRVLADAFLHQSDSAENSSIAALQQVREMGRAIMQMAEEQIAHERRIIQAENRLNKAAIVVADNRNRIIALEKKLISGDPISEEQASQIAQAVKSIAMIWTKQAGSNQFGAVYGRLYEQFGITGYKSLPASRFAEAMEFLTDWFKRLTTE